MSSSKNNTEGTEIAFRSLQTVVVDPLLNHFSSWECKPVERFIQQKDIMNCYTLLFKQLNSRNQSNDNCQEYIYNQTKLIVKQYYIDISKNMNTVLTDGNVIQMICCKWSELKYITEVINVILLYVENNYVERTGSVSICLVIKESFIRYIYNSVQQQLINAIRFSIRRYRSSHIEDDILTYVTEAVSIVYECKEKCEGESLSSFENLILGDVNHFYSQCYLNTTSINIILNDLEKYCLTEKEICDKFGFSHMVQNMQNIVVKCVLDSKLPMILERYMPMLFPSNLNYLKQLLLYVRRLDKGVDLLSDQLKRVLISMGYSLFDKYLTLYQDGEKKQLIEWNYVKELGHHYYKTYGIIESDLESVPSFFQSLYSAVASVTDRCLSAENSVASTMAEYIDHLIRKENLSPSDFSIQINELVFLYSNINNKDEFISTYNVLLSRRLLYSSVFNYDTERNIISRIRASTGLVSVSIMDSILNDINNAMTESFNTKVHEVISPNNLFTYRVNVLTKGVWPSLPESEHEDLDKSIDIICPDEMQSIIEQFNILSYDTERSFKWSFIRGYVNMEMIISDQKVLIQMLPIQAIVLMHFQYDDIISFTDLSKMTGIYEILLKQVISSLIYSKFMLIKKVKGDDDMITNSDSYTFNNEFVSPSNCIRLRGLYHKQKIDQSMNANIKYIESYKAAIVRIVKKEKRISYDVLLKKVIADMKIWNMDITDFKQCLEGLIESEYIERDPNDVNIIIYA